MLIRTLAEGKGQGVAPGFFFTYTSMFYLILIMFFLRKQCSGHNLIDIMTRVPDLQLCLSTCLSDPNVQALEMTCKAAYTLLHSDSVMHLRIQKHLSKLITFPLEDQWEGHHADFTIPVKDMLGNYSNRRCGPYQSPYELYRLLVWVQQYDETYGKACYIAKNRVVYKERFYGRYGICSCRKAGM